MPTLVEIDRHSGLLQRSGRDLGEIPLTALDDWQVDTGHGLLLSVDAEPEPRFCAAPLIAIEFPVFHDGRGLSLAVLLRTRIGYGGELRAVGDVHPELLHYLSRCGFDSCVLPEGRLLPQDEVPFVPHEAYYQASVVEALPAFRRETRGR
ncbi:MAG: DUF934 domain-containing protein [Pseudomonadales bacterium]